MQIDGRSTDSDLLIPCVTTNLETALAHAARGWHVFPVAPDKRPHGMLGTEGGHHHATVDESQIRTWWSTDSTADVGIALAPSGLVVLDVDVHNGKPGMESLAVIESELTSTRIASTRSGGLHLFYSRPPEVAPTRKIAWRPGLDLLGNGYAIAYPADDTAIAELPPLLVNAFTAPKSEPVMNGATATTAGKILEGGRHDAVFQTAVKLRAAGLDHDAILAGLLEHNVSVCDPPLPEDEVCSIAGSVVKIPAGYHGPITDAVIESWLRAPIIVPDEFVLDASGPRVGKPSNGSQRNVRVALKRLGVSLSYDTFARRNWIERDGKRKILGNRDVKALRAELETTFDFKPAREDMFDLADVLSDEGAYHPVRSYLASVEPTWDGVSRVERWLIDAGAPDTPYTRAVSKLVLVGAVRRVRHPGCKFDEMLVIEGEQGIAQKSTAIGILAGEWYGEDLPLGVDSKIVIEKTGGKWIIEAGELKKAQNKRADAIKEFLSRRSDKARGAYERLDEDVPRQFIVVGTTNEANYLDDPTGDRRTWPVRIVRFDCERLARERDQIWAEAARLESAGEPTRMDPSLWDAARAEQEARHEVDPIEIDIHAKLGDLQGKLAVASLYDLLGLVRTEVSETTVKRVSKAIRHLGWDGAVERRNKGAKVRCYVRGDESSWIVVSGQQVTGRADELP